ncbi:MAG: 16S rRNA (uracil(1498)-N(3))-methyltransferase [Firmicutes bacterium]|nr:16S rRNA (uracil(1498)-N(3))-methyltransferase [Bacillota bacterium]
MPTFFVQKESIDGQSLHMRENTHHILRVLRYKPGDELTVCDGEGMQYLCRIDAVGGTGDEIFGTVLSAGPSEGEPRTRITLFQGLPKSDKMEMILEKGVELGISGFVPVRFARCVSRPDDRKSAQKTDRWNKIAASAAEQCGRGILPRVEEPLTVREAAERIAGYDLALVFYEGKKHNSLKEILRAAGTPQNVAVFIGPEGGLEQEEVDLLASHGAQVAGLGPRILRTETAGPAASALILYELDQM